MEKGYSLGNQQGQQDETRYDLSHAQLEALQELAEIQETSLASLIGEAVTDYLNRHPTDVFSESFGLWRARAEDGVQVQRWLRAEWR